VSGVRRALAWSLAERYASLVLTLGSSMLIARLLTPAEIGVYSLCAAAVAIATMVREFGVTEYIVQERELDDTKLRGAFAVAFTTAWGIGTLLWLARSPLAAWYEEPRVAELLAILCLNFVLLPFSSPAYALLNRAVALRPIFVIQLCATVMTALVSVGLAWVGCGAASLAWGALAGVVAQIVAVGFYRPRSSFLWPSFRAAGAVFRYGAYQMASRVSDTLTGNAHEFIIARQFDFTAVGLFSRAKGLVDLFQANVTTAITRVATPTLARAHREQQGTATLVEAYARGTALFAVLAWPFFGFLALAAPEIIRVLLGPQWGAAVPLAQALAVGMLPSALFALGGSVLAALGQVKRRLQVSLWYGPLHVLALLLAAHHGLLAMAWVWLLTTLVIWALYVGHLCQVLHARPGALYRGTWASLPVALASVAVQAAALAALRAAGSPALLTLLGTAVAGALAWAAAARGLRHPAAGELAGLLQRLWPARTGTR
jgi:O-antigen/teichoic acid export membrane protein